MKILVIGAGAVGGYFGGRLQQAGQDVTFLVRPKRAAELKRTRLVIKDTNGEIAMDPSLLITTEPAPQIFDLVVLSAKAHSLEGAIDSLAPAMGPETTVLPLLNGMRHLDILNERFGVEHVLGGLCIISATLDDEGAVLRIGPMHTLTFGEQQGGMSERARRILSMMQGAAFDSYASKAILQEMWEKWVFISSLAGSTTLMRATIGDICSTKDGRDFVSALIDECGEIAKAAGHEPRETFLQRIRPQLTAPNSNLTASMYRDMERNASIEADHIIGDLLQRGLRKSGSGPKDFPLLRLVYANLKAYERRRERA